MGYTAGASSKGGPVFNDAPQTVADFNAGREFTEKLGNRRVGPAVERENATGKNVWDGLEWFDTTDGVTYLYRLGLVVPGWYPKESLVAAYSSANVIVGTGHPNGPGPYSPPIPVLLPALSTPRAGDLFTPSATGAIRHRNAGVYMASYAATLESAANARTFVDLSVPGFADRNSIPMGEDRLNASLGPYRAAKDSVLAFSIYQGGGARQIQNQQVSITYLGPLA